MGLLAASGGDTVKLFDVSGEPGDPCIMSCVLGFDEWSSLFTLVESAFLVLGLFRACLVDLIVASAGEDKKISLWRKNGQIMGTIPVAGTDSGDNIEESILAISFSNKGSRYMCSGGSGRVVRIWDLQRKRCIKWLRGHTNTITGALYNCKDEHLASVSLSGDLILHNLASGARAAELKDPNEQVLRVLDYSRISRHLLVTAGDDGSVHLWDTTGRSPKISWLKQHSAPTAGISFSPSNDKIIASVGLDKKLYTYDSGSRRPSSFISYEAPFSSLAFREDSWILAAGTSSGRVVFYDVRGKPQPFTVLRAYSTSEAVASLCWQRSKPVVVNGSTCTAETALLGGAVEDSILMPDPLPSVTSSSVSLSTAVLSSRNLGRSGLSVGASSLPSTNSGSASSMPSFAEETPHRSHLWPSGTLARLHAPRTIYNFKDDMEVFSPLVDVQPITPSLDKLWDDHEGTKKDNLSIDKKSSSFCFLQLDEIRSSFSLLAGSTPTPSSKSEESSITPPEAWGGERLSDKLTHLHQPLNLPSRFGMLTSGGLQDLPSSTNQTIISSLTNSNMSFSNLRPRDVSSNQESSTGFSELISSSSMSQSGGISQPNKALQLDPQQGNSFTLQLFQRTLEETLDSFQKSIHEDMRNLHIEILRQFHMQEVPLCVLLPSALCGKFSGEKRTKIQAVRFRIIVLVHSSSFELNGWIVILEIPKMQSTGLKIDRLEFDGMLIFEGLGN
ncbi:hypothetical protein GH714_011633 [Hevea brasiliensis]|uniref:Uncharacterized protein n=1 Tax=Hevea brasiliensis TaxID=3981 RepID=A0A6A6N351_HEVBR|nr:hypothetical protein GH714_011633 [Hevea brasiliensis]